MGEINKVCNKYILRIPHLSPVEKQTIVSLKLSIEIMLGITPPFLYSLQKDYFMFLQALLDIQNVQLYNCITKGNTTNTRESWSSMDRKEKSIRMAGETKEWLDKLIVDGQRELRNDVKNGLLQKLEETLLQKYGDELMGTSLSVNLNVSISSVVQTAYHLTKEYSNDKWDELASSMKKVEGLKNIESPSVNPKISFTTEVLEGLRFYQLEFLKLPTYKEAKKAINLGYVLKLVVYAYSLKMNSLQ